MDQIEEETLDNYNIFDVLRENESKQIYQVVSKSSGKTYIIKNIKKSKPPEEINFHRKLSKASPSILQLYLTWSTEELHCMLIEFCECGDLYCYLEQKKHDPDPLSDVIEQCLEISYNVKVLHDLNICHRDIKPHNIFITSSGHFKLGDFENCKEVEDKEGCGLYSLLGTPAYMSPDQMINYKKRAQIKINPYKNDIWSLGKTFFEIATASFYHNMNELKQPIVFEILQNDLKRINYPQMFLELLKQMMSHDGLINIDKVISVLNEVKKSLPVFYYESQESESTIVKPVSISSSPRYIEKPNQSVQNLSYLYHSKPKNNLKFDCLEQKILNDSEIYSGFTVTTIEKPIVSEISKISSESKDFNSIEKIEEESKKILVQRSSKKPVSLKIEEESKKIPVQRSSRKRVSLKFENQSKIAVKQDVIVEKNNPSEPKNKILEESKNTINHRPLESPSSLVIENQPSLVIENQSIIIANQEILNPLPEEQEFSNILIPQCVYCLSDINDQSESLSGCHHLYHPECFKSYYEEPLIIIKKKSDLFCCYRCNNRIEFDVFVSSRVLSEKARYKAKKQNAARQIFTCPNCKIETREFTLSNNLKVQAVTCKVCRDEFCSFCSIDYIILHRKKCESFKKLKNAVTMGDLVK
jgi:serine/threonine protein kinase